MMRNWQYPFALFPNLTFTILCSNLFSLLCCLQGNDSVCSAASTYCRRWPGCLAVISFLCISHFVPEPHSHLNSRSTWKQLRRVTKQPIRDYYTSLSSYNSVTPVHSVPFVTNISTMHSRTETTHDLSCVVVSPLGSK